MTAIAARSQLRVSLLRYARSWGFWVLLLAGLIASRYMVPRGDGPSFTIAIAHQLPVMTSAMVGLSLGIVISTTLLPLGYIYLRSNTNRVQPWQLADVTPASRVAVAFGRFGADAAIFAALLGALTIAGWILAWLLVSEGGFDPIAVAFALWMVAAPALLVLAAIVRLFDARPWLRRWPGDVCYFMLWLASLVVPIAALGESDRGGPFAMMADMPGFTEPLLYGAPPGSEDIAIGNFDVGPGRVRVDAMAGLTQPAYLGSRLLWSVAALLIVSLAGLVHAPQKPRGGGRRNALLSRLLDPGSPPAADLRAAPAGIARIPVTTLVWSEIRLIGGNRLFLIGVVLCALLAATFDHRPMAPALLLLIFAATAYLGQSETRGLLTLTRTARFAPWQRRAASLVAILAWALAMALPALLLDPSTALLVETVGGGFVVAIGAILICAISGSSFAARLLLLITWYGYISS